MKECLTEEILQQYFDGELERVRLESAALHLAGCAACASKLSELENETNFVAMALAPEFETLVPTEHLRRRIDAAIAGQHLVKPMQSPGATSVGRNWLAALSALFSLSPQRTFAYGGLAAVLAFATIVGVVKWQSAPPLTEKGHQVASVPEDVPNPAVSPEDKKVPPIAVTPGVQRFDNADVKSVRKFRPTPQPGPSSQTVAKVKLLPGERSYLKTIAALDSTIKSDQSTMRPALQAEYERNLALVDRAIAATRSAAKSNPNDPDAADFMFAAYQSKVDLLNTIADARVYNRPR